MFSGTLSPSQDQDHNTDTGPPAAAGYSSGKRFSSGIALDGTQTLQDPHSKDHTSVMGRFLDCFKVRSLVQGFRTFQVNKDRLPQRIINIMLRS